MDEKIISNIITKYDKEYLTTNIIDNIIIKFIHTPNFSKEDEIRYYFDNYIDEVVNKDKVINDLFNIINKEIMNALDYLKKVMKKIDKFKYIGIGFIILMILMFAVIIFLLQEYLSGYIIINIGLLIIDFILFLYGIILSIDCYLYIRRLYKNCKSKCSLLVMNDINVFKLTIVSEQKKYTTTCMITLIIAIVAFLVILLSCVIIFSNSMYYELLIQSVFVFIISCRVLIGNFIKKVITTKILDRLVN